MVRLKISIRVGGWQVASLVGPTVLVCLFASCAPKLTGFRQRLATQAFASRILQNGPRFWANRVRHYPVSEAITFVAKLAFAPQTLATKFRRRRH